MTKSHMPYYIIISLISISAIFIFFSNVNYASPKNFETVCWGQQDSIMKHVLYCNKTNLANTQLQEGIDISMDSSLSDFSVKNYHISILQNVSHTRSCSIMPDSDGIMPNDCEWSTVSDSCTINGNPVSWCTINSSDGSDVCAITKDLSKPLGCQFDGRTRMCANLSADGSECTYQTFTDSQKTYFWDEWVPLDVGLDDKKITSSNFSFAPDSPETFKIEWETPIYDTGNGWGSYGNWSINPIGWWNDSWVYRRNITLYNTAGNLTNYQIKIVTNLSSDYSNGRINQTCNDIRFTYYNITTGNETNELNYWIENCNLSSSDNVTLWVNVTYLQNNTNTTIYMYYGNPNASSMSNGNATFIYFDDYSDNNIADWNSTRCGGSSEPSMGAANGVFGVNGTGGNNNHWINRNDFIALSNISIEVKINETSLSSNTNDAGLGIFSSTCNAYWGSWHSNSSGIRIVRVVSGSYATLSNLATGENINRWIKARLDFYNGNINMTFNGTKVNSSDSNFNSGKPSIFFWSSGSDIKNLYDEFFVRKFSGNDPIITVGEIYFNNFTETEARELINLGIHDSLGKYADYSDQEIYARHSDSSQDNGTFDEVVTYGNQTWAFNCITVGESFTNMKGIAKTLNIWENQTNQSEVRSQVSGFINLTKV